MGHRTHHGEEVPSPQVSVPIEKRLGFRGVIEKKRVFLECCAALECK